MQNLDIKPEIEIKPEIGRYQERDPPRRRIPLVVDLDGTLILGDLLHEAIIALLKRSFHWVLFLPLWLLRGRAVLKAELTRRVDLDVSSLVFNQPLIKYLERRKASGKPLFLATGCHESWARKIVEPLGLFDGVFATNGTRNVTSHEKLAVLREHFGAMEFDYAGNAVADCQIWRAARRAIVVNAPRRVARWAARNATVEHVIPRKPARPASVLRALRPHQWLKNLLLFVPLITSLHFADAEALIQLCIGFVAFSLCASSVYVLNDIVDMHDDRRHPRKRSRPFAAGELSVPHGLMLAAVSLGAALALTLLLPWRFGAVLAVYYMTTFAYTFKLKQLEVIDVLTLALLYTTRIFAGGMAADITLSVWLLAFAIFVFLSLALAKRCTELMMLHERNEKHAHGRGYCVSDLPLLHGMGTGSGYVAALVLGLYTNSYQVGQAYTHPWFLWVLVPLLIYWIMRLWLKTYRGEMHDDPVIFAARDPASLAIAGVFGVTIWLAM